MQFNSQFNLLFSLLVSLILISNNALAQSNNCENSIKSIAITDSGQYVMAYNFSDAVWTSDLNQKMIDKIWDLYDRDINIKQITIQNDGDYVILYNKNDAQWTNIPEDLSDKIMELNDEDKAIKNITLREDDAFVILWDKNEAMWTLDVPKGLIDAIKQLNKDDEMLKQALLFKETGYMLLWGKNNVEYDGEIPEALILKIDTLQQQDAAINYIELAENGEFIVVWNEHQFLASQNIHPNLQNKLQELSCSQAKDSLPVKDEILKPTVTWQTPEKKVTYVTRDHRAQTISICIQSQVEIDEIKVYKNGRAVKTRRNLPIDEEMKGGCAYIFEYELDLDTDENRIKVKVTNRIGETTSYTRLYKVIRGTTL